MSSFNVQYDSINKRINLKILNLDEEELIILPLSPEKASLFMNQISDCLTEYYEDQNGNDNS